MYLERRTLNHDDLVYKATFNHDDLVYKVTLNHDDLVSNSIHRHEMLVACDGRVFLRTIETANDCFIVRLTKEGHRLTSFC